MKGLFGFCALIVLLSMCIACNAERPIPTAGVAATIAPPDHSALLLSQRSLSGTSATNSTVPIPRTQVSVATPTASAASESITPSPWPTVPPQGTIHANAVAFVVGDWQDGRPDSLWIANIDGSGETKILDEVYRVSWAPDGQWLGCVREDGLWIVSPDARKRIRVLANDSEKGDISRMAWSPDGTRIAFVQIGENGSERLGIVEVASGKVTYLAAGYPVLNLTWSPDGRWLAFSKGFVSFEVIEVTNAIFKTVNTSAACNGNIHLTTWSPSGDRIAFLSYGNGRYAHGTACLSTLSMYSTWLDVGGHSTNPVWAPHGEGIYVVATNFNPDDPDLKPDPRLLYFDSSGQFVERLASVEHGGGGEIETLTLSPDGQWLAILALKHPRSIIQFFNVVDRQTLTRTVDTPGELLYASSPRDLYKWSADSQYVVLMTGRYSTPNGVGVRQYGALYALNFQTGTWRQLTHTHWIKQFTTSPTSGK